MRRPFRRRPEAPELDVVFVVAPQNRGWILEAICREVAERMDGPSAILDAGTELPAAKAYFFSHYSLFRNQPWHGAVQPERSLVWYTHPTHGPREARGIARQLARARAVVATSSVSADDLLQIGVPRRKVEVVIPGADPVRFRPHGRGGGAVGFCSAYYPRKAPEIVVDVAMALPERQVRLLGRGWEASPGFDDLVALPNFEYLESGYDDYPAFYASLDVLVSPSRLEGGPIPLLEAMMSNVVPVATRTGFAPDLIVDGVNGVLCDVGAPGAAFVDAIARADQLTADVRATVERYTWDAFAARILSLAGI